MMNLEPFNERLPGKEKSSISVIVIFPFSLLELLKPVSYAKYVGLCVCVSVRTHARACACVCIFEALLKKVHSLCKNFLHL